MEWVYPLGFLLAIIIHELGHLVPLWIFCGKFPGINFNKFLSISVGDKEIAAELTLKQATVVSFLGIVFGLVPIIYFGNFWLLFFYWLACSSDICNVVLFFKWNKFVDVKLKYIKTIGV